MDDGEDLERLDGRGVVAGRVLSFFLSFSIPFIALRGRASW